LAYFQQSRGGKLDVSSIQTNTFFFMSYTNVYIVQACGKKFRLYIIMVHWNTSFSISTWWCLL